MFGRTMTAHRAAWTLQRGPIPPGVSVCHRCDNRLCANVAHLFLGTNADNVADMVAKGRQARGGRISLAGLRAAWAKLAKTGQDLRGEKNPRAKLTREQVEEIRRLTGAGMRGVDVAARFGVSESTVRHIKNGLRWNPQPPKRRTGGAKCTQLKPSRSSGTEQQAAR